MKFVASILFLLLFNVAALAQADSAHWHFTFANAAPRLNEDNQLIISADLPEGWGLYSTDFTQASIGPAPTVIAFESPIEYAALDALRPIKPVLIEDKTFELTYTYFVGNAEFRQCIQFIAHQTRIKGTIRGHLFHLASGKTVPFQKPFDLTVKIDSTN